MAMPAARSTRFPMGRSFQPGLDPNNANIDQFRPLQGFQDVNIITHGLYQNYNSLQLSWSRTAGRYNMMFNYTFGKSMGIVPGAATIGPVQSEQQLWCASV